MGDAHLNPGVRHDVLLLFDATDANPNGDPDGHNEPRSDAETGHGLVTDVAIKRKIRDTVAELRGGEDGYQIFVEAGRALSPRAEEGWRASGGSESDALAWLCARYFDVRMFGAVLTRGKGKGAAGVRGPMQVGFARSIDPISPVSHAITRVTQSRQADLDRGESTEMGSKWTVPYGLYRAHMHYSAPLAAKTGVTGDDLAMLWQALTMMFDLRRSARGSVDLAGLWVFSHPDRYGVAPARTLLDRVEVSTVDAAMPARSCTDYRRELPGRLPAGVQLTTLADVWNEDTDG